MLLTDADHAAALRRSISNIFQSRLVEPGRTDTNSFAICMVNMAFKSCTGPLCLCECVHMGVCVCVHMKAAVLWNVN